MLKALAIALLLVLYPTSLALAHGNPTECVSLWEPNDFVDPASGPLNSIWRVPFALTIQETWCQTDPAGATVTIDPEVGGKDILTDPLVCSSGGADGTIYGRNNRLEKGDLVDMGWTVATNNPTRLTVCFAYSMRGAL